MDVCILRITIITFVQYYLQSSKGFQMLQFLRIDNPDFIHIYVQFRSFYWKPIRNSVIISMTATHKGTGTCTLRRTIIVS